MDKFNFLLVAAIAAMLIGLYKGYRKGFLRLAVYLAGLVFVVLIVTKISPLLSDYLRDNTDLYSDVRQKIIRIYEEKNELSLSTGDIHPENQEDSIVNMGLPDIIASALVTNNNSEVYKLLAATLFEEYISGYLAAIVIKAGSYVILFMILGLVMLITLCAIKIIEQIPVLRSFNRILGMLAGWSMSLIFIWVFYIGIMMLFANSLGGWLMEQVRASDLLTILFNNNPLLKFLLKV